MLKKFESMLFLISPMWPYCRLIVLRTFSLRKSSPRNACRLLKTGLLLNSPAWTLVTKSLSLKKQASSN